MSDQSEGNVLVLRLSLDLDYHRGKEQLLAAYEREFVSRAILEAGYNLSRASRLTGMSRKHLRTLMQKHGMRISRTVTSKRDGQPSRFIAAGTNAHCRVAPDDDES